MEIAVNLSESFKDFVRKSTLGYETDVPIELTSEKVLIRRSDLAMKVYGEFKSFDVVTGEINETILLGIPNARKLIKYLTVLDGNPLFIKKLDETDIDKLFIIDTKSTDLNFSVILSVLSQPDVKPLNLSDFAIDIKINSEKIKKMFEVMKLISSEECGILLRKNDSVWDVVFKVGSKYEDKGEVTVTTLKSFDFQKSKFIVEIEKDQQYFIKYQHKDIVSTLGVMDKTNEKITTYFRLKRNGALILTEECEEYVIHYGFVPYV